MKKKQQFTQKTLAKYYKFKVFTNLKPKVCAVFKGVLFRKRKKIFFAGIKNHDVDELQEVDTDFFKFKKDFILIFP